MASTTFIDNQTTIYAAWLNDVNNAVYNGIFVSPSITATSMICNGTASGAGFTNLINNTFTAPGPIGSVTPSTGKFTTLTTTTPIGVASGGTGLTSPGASGNLLTSNGTAWTSAAPIVIKGLGLAGETWHNVTSSRAISTTYTNTNTYPISVAIIAGGSNTNWGFSAFVSGNLILQNGGYSGAGSGITNSLNFIVPPSATYSVSASGLTLTTWFELY
jgi:hypothetical protein